MAFFLRKKVLQIQSMKAQIKSNKKILDSSVGIYCGEYHFYPSMEDGVLGEGAFGKVYRVMNPHDLKKYAVNCLNLLVGAQDGDSMEELKSLQEEVQKL